jgi:hypothetical protein
MLDFYDFVQQQSHSTWSVSQGSSDGLPLQKWEYTFSQTAGEGVGIALASAPARRGNAQKLYPGALCGPIDATSTRKTATSGDVGARSYILSAQVT